MPLKMAIEAITISGLAATNWPPFSVPTDNSKAHSNSRPVTMPTAGQPENLSRWYFLSGSLLQLLIFGRFQPRHHAPEPGAHGVNGKIAIAFPELL